MQSQGRLFYKYVLKNQAPDGYLPRMLCMSEFYFEPWAIAIIVAMSLMLILLLIGLFYYRPGMRFAIVQHVENAKKRLMASGQAHVGLPA
jgi:hypothetical protein